MPSTAFGVLCIQGDKNGSSTIDHMFFQCPDIVLISISYISSKSQRRKYYYYMVTGQKHSAVVINKDVFDSLTNLPNNRGLSCWRSCLSKDLSLTLHPIAT